MASTSDEILMAAALQLFNDGQYLAAHEVLDELWEATSGPDADFYKGLIQASIALHPLEGGNTEGARKLETGTRRLLAPFLPTHRGLDLAGFLDGLRQTLRGTAGSPPRLS